MDHLQSLQRWQFGKCPRFQVFDMVEMEISEITIQRNKEKETKK